jgi:hypothetical protein
MESTTWKELLAAAKPAGRREMTMSLLEGVLKDSAKPFEPALQEAGAEVLAEVVRLLARRLSDAELVQALTRLLGRPGA